MRWVLLIGAGLLLLLVVLAFCLPVPLPRVDDIAVTSVQLVQDVPKQDRDFPLRGMDGPFLRLNFTSRHDFQKLAHDWNYTLGFWVASCTGGDVDETRPLADFGAVNDRHGPVHMYDDKHLTSGPGPLFHYHIYVAVRAEPNLDVDTGQPQPDYDLKAHPQDICLRLQGRQEVDGDGWGFARFQANVARISKDAVAGALR